ncbi:YbaN family protein [Petrocella sp. FN5]|uniref:YbaN family protein n=1 Tax=Petrocella sp. FN5 TaxID=3032002 RepID=UPI0023D9E012|nr:YbaN family protein [Petrocella sp. FN5]MDF1615886.1 YbaN family protein [Petrocella sp. FN5]
MNKFYVKTRKYFLLTIGTIAVFLGVLGIFLPLLPTTPFLLLASYCYLRSSKKMYHWIMNHKTFGSYIHNYIEYKAIKKRTRISALLFLWGSLGFSIYLAPIFHVKILLVAIGTGVTIHLITLKTMPKDDETNPNRFE